MSRRSSFHESQGYSDDPFDGSEFALPLFNSGPPPAVPHIKTRPHELTSPRHSYGFGPPQSAGSGHQHRHSVAYSGTGISPYSSGVHSASPISGPPPASARKHRPSMSSQFSSYAQQTFMSGGQTPAGYPGQEELLPVPPSSSGSAFGSLARSASLGPRKKDPYHYSSDDVESGMGDMSMRGDTSPVGDWRSYGQQAQHPPPMRHSSTTQLLTMPSGRSADGDVLMSPPHPGSAASYQHDGGGAMGPPALPSYVLTRPQQVADPNSGHHTPHRPSLPQSQSSPLHNPYLPRQSDPGPSSASGTGLPAYRHTGANGTPSQAQRMSSSGSFNSNSDQLSPYARARNTDHMVASPSLLNPYDASPQLMPTSPGGAGLGLGSGGLQWPASPGMPALRSHSSHPLYPASSPVTPAGKYDPGPPRGQIPNRRSPVPNANTSRQGMRLITQLSDLKPVVNSHPGGRRADPDRPGKYLSPLKCLTSALPQTFTLCNPNFHYESSDNPRRVLTKPSKPAHNDGADNEDWDYILYVNDVLGGEHGGDRYLILDVLGQGTFGQVVKCQNMRNHEICAVKVVKNKPAYLNQSKMEVAILDLLNNQYDPNDAHHILRMLESFTHKNHLCLVFECLSSNLYELIKQNQFKGLSVQLVKVFTQQLLECLAVLKDARLIHCDLKPENILLKSLQSPQIKVIDFGSACHEMQTVYTYIQSRFYRSPEVLLGLPYSTSIDMWSLGCIVVELFLGLPLFPGTSEYNQVSRIVDMLGNPPQHLLEVGKQTHEFFNFGGVDTQGRKQYFLKSMDQYSNEHHTQEQPSKQYFKQTKLKDIIMEYPMSKKNAKQSEIDKEMANRRSFVDFCEGLLTLDPLKRWSPQQAAKHPFITGERSNEPPHAQPTPARKQSYNVPESPSGSSSSKKYGGLVSSPSAARGQRIYSDAAAYNQQLAHHQSYTAQQAASSQARRQPFGQGYEMPTKASPQSHPQQPRLPSQSHRASQSAHWAQNAQHEYQPRIPSHGMGASASHSALRPAGNANASSSNNPPSSSYYSASRNRANTINQIDAIPPALARLTHFGAQDPSGSRNLTPVLRRDDAIREWERRHAGHSKKNSFSTTTYPQLEYLQEQAELAAMSGQPWMFGGSYVEPGLGPSSHQLHAPIQSLSQSGLSQSGSSRHRPHLSTSAHSQQGQTPGQGYQMQPGIGNSPQSSHGPDPYRRTSEYDPSPTSTSTAYLPAYPPPAATSGSVPLSAGSSGPLSGVPGGFDAFDTRDTGMGMMYNSLQPAQAGQYGGSYAAVANPASGHGQSVGGGHQSRASFGGVYPGSGNPFASPGGSAPGHGSGRGQAQGQEVNSPGRRYQRRSQQFGA